MSNFREKLQEQASAYTDKMKKIDFQTDTVSNSGFAGYFSPDRNSITLNYREDDEYGRKWLRANHEGLLYHEEKHRSNEAKGLKEHGLSLEQYYKICMANEISAEMATLVYLREQYIKTGDINVFNYDYMDFYKQAIQSGSINPRSLDAKDFGKDMSLIMNGTKDMWMNKFAKSYDESSHVDMTEYYYNKVGLKAKRNDANYQKCLDIAFTVGGVNFNKYLNKDIECINPSIIDADKQLTKGQKPILQKLQYVTPYQPYNEKLSFVQYNNLLQHKFIAEKFKSLSGLDSDYLRKCSTQDKLDAKKFYSSYLPDFKEMLLKDNSSLRIQKMVCSAVEKVGGRLPNGDNKEYLAELDKIYTVNDINLREFLEIDPNMKMPVDLPAEVKSFEKKNFLQRLKQSTTQWRQKVTDKISSWFSKKKKEKKFNNDGLVLPINRKDPQYHKWSKEKRVSEVQHINLLNMDKDIIKKPQVIQKDKTTSTKTGKFAIELEQITSSYNTKELRDLCSSEVRWNQGRSCDAQQYCHAAEVTGIPAELIAYVYEVNRKNFPDEARLADKVKNGAQESDLETAQNIASILGRYDIERGSFFALRESPKQININTTTESKIKKLLQRNLPFNSSSNATYNFRRLRGMESGIENRVYKKSNVNINDLKRDFVNA